MPVDLGALIIVAWPQTPVRPTGFWYDRLFGLLGLQLRTGLYRLGHAGCLLVSESTGRAHYFDCGRYECPPQMCRIRDDVHDPEVALSVQARFAADGSLVNGEEVLLELAGNRATHGEGFMVASVMGGLRFEAAYREAKGLQERMYPFRHLAPRSLNCTRFLLRMTPFARAPLAVRALEAWSPLFGPSPLFLARVASPGGPIYMVEQGRLSRCGRWSAFLHGRPPILSSLTHERCEGPAVPPQREAGVPPEARWLSGTAVGKWIALTRELGLGSGEFRFRRWSDSGRQDCDRVFALCEGGEFDSARPFEPGYPTHSQECTLHQDGRTSRLELVREFGNVSSRLLHDQPGADNGEVKRTARGVDGSRCSPVLGTLAPSRRVGFSTDRSGT